MRHVVVAVLLFLFSCAAYAEDFAQPVYITGMRISPSQSKTIMTFELSGATSGLVKFFPKENLLILKFTRAVLRFHVQHAKLGGANVAEFSAKALPDHSVEWSMQTVGKVTWTTQLNMNPKTKRVELILEVISANVPKTIPPEKITGRARLENKPSDARKNSAHVFTVVIDAGHGGKDTGAISKNGTREKDVVLAISKKLAAKLGKNPGVRVVLTRHGDYYIPLRGRLGIARHSSADLFIAVHADAYFNNVARGASVYALSSHGATNEASRWLAQQERYAEIDGIDFDSLPDQSKMVRSVLIDLSQTATIRDSLHLGNKVLDSLDRISKLHYRHVEQAPFVVLKSPDIPSILVETGFVSNPYEAAELASPSYQDKLADALARGVTTYIKKYASK